jgi:flagellar biosynthesis protein FliQ
LTVGEEWAVGAARLALQAAAQAAIPLLLAALASGVVMSVLMAVTQVQEPSLAFVPKLLAVAAAAWLFREPIAAAGVDLLRLVARKIAEGG